MSVKWKICHEHFHKVTQLMAHFKPCKEMPFTCEICNETFLREDDLIDHEAIHFSAEQNRVLDKHIMMIPSAKKLSKYEKCSNINTDVQEEDNFDENSFFCELCFKPFSHKESLMSHMRMHGSRQFECKVCQKVFKLNRELVHHARVHTGEKPFKCDLCLLAFSQRCSLLCHQRTHSGINPFVCNVCHQKFSRKGNLVRHMKSDIHAAKIFKCTTCDRTFTTKQGLGNHLRVHSKLKRSVKCLLCDKAFSQRKFLISHAKKVHSTVDLAV